MAIQRSTLVTKAQELMNTEGLDYATAARKARDTMNATNTATVSATSAGNQMQYEINKQNRQNMANAGTIPAVGTSVTPQAGQTQAPTPSPNPVLPTTPTTTPSGATMNADGTVTPATPAPTPTPAPENPKVETQAPTPVTPTAVTPVVDKVSETKAKNEAQMALNKQQAELKQAERDKLTAEANNQLANNEGAILNTLKTGGVIPESVKTSPFYKSAQQTYNKLQQYSTYSTNELVTAMNQGSIVPGTNVYNEMMKDPVMKQKLTDAQIYRAGDPVNSTQIYENASTEIMSNNPTTANYLADEVITQAEYDQATNNAQVVAKAKEVEEKANKYNTLKAEYDSIEDEVNAQFPGSPFADSIIADRQKAKYKNLVLAKGEWETATGTLIELKSQASTLFETNLNLAEKRREEQNQLLAEQRKIQAEKDMLQYKSDFEKKQAQEALNDPATQIKATMDEFAKLGIVSQGDLTSKIAEFKASGKTLPEYITGLRQQFMSKPEYKKIQELQAGQLSDAQKLQASQAFDLKKMGLEQNFQMQLAQAKQTTNNKWTKLDDGMYTNEAGEIITADELKNAKLLNNSYITKPIGAVGGDCGVYASRSTGMSSTPGGNSKEARFKAFSETTPQVGGMAFFGGEGYDKTYGHIAIVTGVNADGTITVKDSNYRGDGKVAERTVKADTVSGYYNNTPLAKGFIGGGVPTTKDLKSSDIEVFNSLTATDKKKLQNDAGYSDFQTTKANIMNDENANIFDVMKYSQGGKDMGEERLKSLGKFSQGLSQIADLSKAINEQTTGPILGTLRSYNPYDSNAQALVSQINSVVPNIARGVYGEVGVLTDADIQNYAKTLPNIRSTEDTNKLVLAMTLKTMLNGFKSQIQMDGAAGRDVSGFGGTVKQYETKINNLLSEINGKQSNTAPVDVAGQLKASNGKTYTF